MFNLFNRLKADERGVSSVIGGLVVMSALFGFTTYVLVHKARQGQMRAEGLVDVMEQAEKRQAQLIDFSYADNAGGALHVYLANYGWENAYVDRVWVDGSVVDGADWSVRLATTGSSVPENALPNGGLCYVEIANLSGYAGKSDFPFAILTDSESIYKWRVTV